MLAMLSTVSISLNINQMDLALIKLAGRQVHIQLSKCGLGHAYIGRQAAEGEQDTIPHRSSFISGMLTALFIYCLLDRVELTSLWLTLASC